MVWCGVVWWCVVETVGTYSVTYKVSALSVGTIEPHQLLFLTNCSGVLLQLLEEVCAFLPYLPQKVSILTPKINNEESSLEPVIQHYD